MVEYHHLDLMIEVRNLCKSLSGKEILKNISFSVEKGTIAGFLGPNGAGKTTTMRIITGYLKPDSGEVFVNGYSYREEENIKKVIGYLPENPPLYGDMTVEEYLTFVGKLKGLSKGLLSERMDYVIDKCGLSEFSKRLIRNLSKGQKQRVGVAQAIIHDPDVLVFDEPTIGLDPKQKNEIRGLIKDLGKEKTIILSTHILPEVEEVCEKVIIINEGSIVAEGSKEEVSSMAGGEKILLRVKGGNPLSLLEGTLGIKGVEEKEGGYLLEGKLSQVPEIARILVENGYEILELRPDRPSLEEVFLRLTMGEG